MYELVIDICNDLDVTSLCHKILQNVCLLVNADRCSLFLVQGEDDNRLLQHFFSSSYGNVVKVALGVEG